MRDFRNCLMLVLMLVVVFLFTGCSFHKSENGNQYAEIKPAYGPNGEPIPVEVNQAFIVIAPGASMSTSTEQKSEGQGTFTITEWLEKAAKALGVPALKTPGPDSKPITYKPGETGTGDPVVHENKVYGKYHGRPNADRPQWYFPKKKEQYPAEFVVVIDGCTTGWTVKNDGGRFQEGQYLAKPSEVSGRGMVILAPSSCKSKKAYIKV